MFYAIISDFGPQKTSSLGSEVQSRSNNQFFSPSVHAAL